jgi:hypothetical protein
VVHSKKRNANPSVKNVERSHRNKEYRPRLGEFECLMDWICIFHPHGKHKTRDCDRLQGFAYEVLKMAKKANQEKKPEGTKGSFPEAHKEANYIYGGHNSYESSRKQKLTAQEVMVVHPATVEYLKWSVVSNVKDVRLNRVLVDGGSSLNILFLKTFEQKVLLRIALCPCRAPFHTIVPGAAATPVKQITLPVTFETQENICIEHLQFEVDDFETVYNTFLGRLALTKFTAIPHYAYFCSKDSRTA